MNVIETAFDGHRFRSRTEARWAVFFTAAGLRYEYEREGFDLGGRWYLPDFYLPNLGLWLEVKGADPTPEEVQLCRRLAVQTGRDTLLAIGPPRPYDQLRWFKAKPGEWDDDMVLWHFADDRRNEREFWLLSESTTAAASIGPVRGPVHDRFPLVHAATRRAYDAAAGARFEHGETGMPSTGSTSA